MIQLSLCFHMFTQLGWFRMMGLMFQWLCLIGTTSMAYADIPETIEFAKQASKIAGSAQACGQNTSILDGRIKEAIDAMSQSQVESMMAYDTYTTTSRSVKKALNIGNKANCDAVLQDYQSLPIMQKNYKQSVIRVLASQASSAASQPKTQSMLPGSNETISALTPSQSESMSRSNRPPETQAMPMPGKNRSSLYMSEVRSEIERVRVGHQAPNEENEDENSRRKLLSEPGDL